MNQTSISSAAASPAAIDRIVPPLLAWGSRLLRAVRALGWERGMPRHAATALEDLDARGLRDIGAREWLVAREVERDRAELQWRIDSQFRG